MTDNIKDQNLITAADVKPAADYKLPNDAVKTETAHRQPFSSFDSNQAGKERDGKMPKNEYTHQWTDWKGCSCACQIRVFEGAGENQGKTVVIATDINHGTSVTNEAERIGTDIVRLEAIAPDDLILIEHYDEDHRPKFDETFDLVELKWNNRERKFIGVNWQHFTKEKTEELIGEKLS